MGYHGILSDINGPSTHTDFAEAVRKAAVRYWVVTGSRGDGIAEGRVRFRDRDEYVTDWLPVREAQSEADRLNNAAVLAMVGPLVEAGQALLDALDAALPHIDNAIQIATMHHCPYTGPQLAEPMADLRAALATLETTRAQAQEAGHGD